MPSSLTEMGLPAALREMATNVSASEAFKMELVMENDLILPSLSEVSIYRLIQEIVNNVLRHSKASRVDVTIGNENALCFIEISDNGTGFDTATITQSKGIGWKIFFQEWSYLMVLSR